MDTENLKMLGTPYDLLKPLFERKLEVPLSKILQKLTAIAKNEIATVYDVYSMYATIADQKPDDAVQRALTKYKHHINQMALKVKKAVTIVPPADFEKPLIKFLGLDYKETKYFFQPISSK